MQLNHAVYVKGSNYMCVIAYHRKIIMADKQVGYSTAILQGKGRSKAGNPRTLAGLARLGVARSYVLIGWHTRTTPAPLVGVHRDTWIDTDQVDSLHFLQAGKTQKHRCSESRESHLPYSLFIYTFFWYL